MPSAQLLATADARPAIGMMIGHEIGRHKGQLAVLCRAA